MPIIAKYYQQSLERCSRHKIFKLKILKVDLKSELQNQVKVAKDKVGFIKSKIVDRGSS